MQTATGYPYVWEEANAKTTSREISGRIRGIAAARLPAKLRSPVSKQLRAAASVESRRQLKISISVSNWKIKLPVSLHICMYICAYISVYIYICTRVYIYIYIHMHGPVTCITYVYIYIHIHMYAHTYVLEISPGPCIHASRHLAHLP